VHVDLAAIALATLVAHLAWFAQDRAYSWVAGPYLSGGVFCACMVVAGLIFGLYERATLAARSRILVRSATTLALGVSLAYAVLFVFLYAGASRWLGLFVAAGFVAISLPARLIAHNVLTTSRVRVLCVGGGEPTRQAVDLLRTRFQGHFEVVGHATIPSGEPRGRVHRRPPSGCPWLGDVGEIVHLIRAYDIDEIVVDTDLTSNALVGEAALACLAQRRRVTDQATFLERLLGEAPAESITAQWFLLADVQASGGYEALKRVIDVAAALAGLLITGSLFPLIAAAIRVESRGPAIYRQQRVGVHGRVFTLFKFRTMWQDAEANGARWAAPGDPRVTRFGRLLRRTRIDELPQLWNVLRGDMSLVGPRPERPEFVERLAQAIPHYRERHLIKPGLTGWAQIQYGYGASVEDARRKLCYDLYYLKHRCTDFDFAVIFRTIGTFLLGAR